MTTPAPPKFYRQRFLLELLAQAGGRLSKMDFQKLLFVSQQETDCSYYDFVPYRYGCYSFQAHSDMELLQARGWIDREPKTITLLHPPPTRLTCETSTIIKTVLTQLAGVRGKQLLTYIYQRYPYYATRSKIAKEVLDQASYRNVILEKQKFQQEAMMIFTIGYEGRSLESYVNQLIRHNISLLVDVRKNPLSRKFGFSKGTLSRLLPKFDITYLHLPSLGIPSSLRQELNTQEDYTRLFQHYRQTLPQQETSLHTLESSLKEYQRMALTCFEKAYASCHRHCVSDYLQSTRQFQVSHL